MPVLTAGTRDPLWWGMVLFVLIDAVILASLIASYFYLRFHLEVWPPEGIATPDLLLGTAAGLLLLASSGAIGWAERGIRVDRTGRLQLGLALGVLLAAGALALQVTERLLVDYRWDTHAYGSIVWLTLGFHATQVLLLTLTGALLLSLALRGYYNHERRMGVRVIALWWHFVALAWIPLLAVVFLVPRWW